MTSQVARSFVAFLITCLAAFGQNVTLPSAMDGVEGGSGTNIPFGSSLACRYQCIYNANTLPWTGPRLISGLKLRADNGSPLQWATVATPAKGFLVVSVLMSTTYASALSPSSTFEDNRGIDRQWVLQNYHLQLPMQPVLNATGPRPANIDLPFTTPWWYGMVPARGNQPAPANLLVEIWIHSQPTGAYRIDNLGGCIAPVTSFGQQGTLCASPGLTPPTVDSDPSMIAGTTYSWQVDDAPPNAPFVLVIGATNQGGFLGQAAYPLPYPMFDPQNPSLPSPALQLANLGWSAPDCWLNLDPGAGESVFGVADANGHGVVTAGLPAGSQHVGTELFVQAFIYAQTANALQVITTMGRSSTVCGPLDVARIYAFYDNTATPQPPPPTSGAVQYGLGMILEVQ